jgi:hypothetical protein
MENMSLGQQNRIKQIIFRLKNLYGDIDFKLLLNEHTFIQKGDDKIALIGVENWGQNFKRQVILIKLLTGYVKKTLKS